MKLSMVRILVFGLAALTVASAQPSSDATLQALLSEVRLLRQALEKSAILAPRIQLTLQRMQLQQASVVKASHDLAQLRERLAKAANEESGFAAEAKALQAMAAKENDAARRSVLENRVKAMQGAMEQQRMLDSQLRATESDLAGVLRVEQGRWDELQARLDALERSLETLAAK